jgi:glucose/mannose-6-phosphate isomerase
VDPERATSATAHDEDDPGRARLLSEPLQARPDTLGMWDALSTCTEQIATAVRQAEPRGPLPDPGRLDNVVIYGMDAGAMTCDLLEAVAVPLAARPLVALKSHDLPAFVGASSLLLAVTWSGEMEETLVLVDSARAAGASVVVVTKGGTLATLTERHGQCIVPIPTEAPDSRVSLGALCALPAVVLERLGLLEGAVRQVEEAVEVLEQRRNDWLSTDGLAASVARRIGRTFPLVHGSRGPAAVSARHWKSQVNINAKTPAFWSFQPDLCQDEIAGWGQAGDVTRPLLTVVSLRHDGGRPGVAARFSVVNDMLREVVADVIEVRSRAKSALAVFFDLAMLGDAVSLHLAAKEGVDPGPVPIFAELQEALGT